MKDNQWWKYMECKPSEDLDLNKIIKDLNKEIVELKRDNTLLSYDVATLTNRIQEFEKSPVKHLRNKGLI